MTPTRTAPRQHADAAQFSPDRLKTFIETGLRRREEPARIAAGVYVCFGIKIDPDQVIPYWKGEIAFPTQTAHRQDADEIALPTQTERRQDTDEIALPTQTERRQDADDAPATQTEHRPDKESVQIPADEAKEPLFTHTAEVEPSAQTLFSIAPVSAVSGEDDAPATQTGRRQDAESLHIPADPVDEPKVTREARHAAIDALGALVKARLGITDAEDAATQTGHRQEQKTQTVLTDEVKAFIVRGLARYETPTRVAASVQATFGIAIDRRQVYAYDPAGSRPPAQRWIDLHAATRAKFLEAAAEIGIAHKVVRLRMLDRFANRADENNQWERAAAFMAQAAKECGGFYERFARPKREAAAVST
jgi:hypothetical protein